MTTTPRDTTLLRDLWLLRYCTTQQLTRLHFCNHRLAQRRLRILATRGLVDRFRPDDAIGRTWWYRLARPGAQIVAEDQGVPVTSILPPYRSPRRLGSLAHHALTTDVRIWLREGCTASNGLFSVHFIPDYEEVRVAGRRQRRIALPVPGHRQALIPDGAFVLKRRDGRSALFTLEIDRGTEPLTGRHPSAIEHKFTRYQAAYDAGAEAHYEHLFGTTLTGFRVLCLVPDQKRQQRFISLATRFDLTPLVWVATHALMAALGDLDAARWSISPDEPLHRLTE